MKKGRNYTRIYHLCGCICVRERERPFELFKFKTIVLCAGTVAWVSGLRREKKKRAESFVDPKKKKKLYMRSAVIDMILIIWLRWVGQRMAYIARQRGAWTINFESPFPGAFFNAVIGWMSERREREGNVDYLATWKKKDKNPISGTKNFFAQERRLHL